ncbi:ATP-binding protein [Evansella cellulosilytica]|uniref:Circadian input-output histidine kinase CikA n=1 Tax=Evansella cellulosilytica (strain ATCC 21833 / DSM 2522 / FERM P-1141 / JCM 9156 / N-4) TaxID=649639 RepID=E6U274_EVAC2|nr:ATP-binding protein [Evansella cellulosilytica]ADU30452.1 multi-sensor hybrid histidine kinase [Evansella cellulosilytica DSM 2522]
MKIKTKLLLGFASIITIVLFIGVYVLFSLNEQRNELTNIVNENYERVSYANDIKFLNESIATNLREMLLFEETVEESILYDIKQSRSGISVAFDSLRDITTNEETRSNISHLSILNEQYDTRINDMISLYNNGDTQEAIALLEKNNELRAELIAGILELNENEELTMQEAIAQSDEAYERSLIILSSLLAISIIIVSSISVSVIKSVNKSIHKVRSVMTAVSTNSKEKLPRIQVKNNDEIADIANAYNDMAASLEQSTENEKKLNQSLIEDNWIKTSYAQLAEDLQGYHEVHKFGETFLRHLAPLVKATYGVFYLIEDGKYLYKQAAYATDNTDIGKERIAIGQGLAGQCAADKTVMVVDPVPDGYATTESGIGQASTRALVILPIVFEKRVIGVLELAKFESFTQLQMNLLEQVCNSLGTSIQQILDHIKISDLLTESQTTTEELQTQSEELQQQQEELRMINEKLHEQYKESDQKTKELEKIKEDLEEKNKSIQLSSRYKSEFLANMSHELRTPLNSILILSQMLSENANGNLSKKQIEHAETIYSSGKDLLDLINDILDLSKIESGKVEVYPEELFIEDMRAFVERQFHPIAEQKGLQFNCYIHQETPSILYTDDQRLKQILKNLLSNAFKFTAQGTVRFEVHPSYSESTKVVFSIIDTGIGIPPEKQESVFEAFHQGDGTTTREYGGTGLGLSISRELANLLGGRIEVVSEDGKGSTFSLYLPDYDKMSDADFVIAESEVASTNEDIVTITNPEIVEKVPSIVGEENVEKTKAVLENKVVLIVDDDMRNVFALTAALESQNMEVVFAENGSDAIEMLEGNKTIDIVLMDIMMPVMDGYEAMKAIRTYEQFKELPIIALTAKAMKNDREKCIQAGASDYISKPVDMEQLLSLMKVWLYEDRKRG